MDGMAEPGGMRGYLSGQNDGPGGESMPDPGGECASLIVLASLQIAHVGAGLAEWTDVLHTLGRAQAAATAAIEAGR